MILLLEGRSGGKFKGFHDQCLPSAHKMPQAIGKHFTCIGVLILPIIWFFSSHTADSQAIVFERMNARIPKLKPGEGRCEREK